MRVTESLEQVIWRMLEEYFPNQCNASYRLIKACLCQVKELKRYKKLTEPEIAGNNYLFWCWKNDDQKEPTFLFGQCTIFNDELYFGIVQCQYIHWAKMAYHRKWIDMRDKRNLIVSFGKENSMVP